MLLLYLYLLVAFANTSWDISIAQYIGMSDKHYSSMFLCDEWLQACKDNSHQSLSADVSLNAAAVAVAVANIAAVPATTTTLPPSTLQSPVAAATPTVSTTTPLSPSMNATTPLQQQPTTTTTTTTNNTVAALDHYNLTKSDLTMIDKTIANFLQQATQCTVLPMGQALLGYTSQEQVCVCVRIWILMIIATNHCAHIEACAIVW